MHLGWSHLNPFVDKPCVGGLFVSSDGNGGGMISRPAELEEYDLLSGELTINEVGSRAKVLLPSSGGSMGEMISRPVELGERPLPPVELRGDEGASPANGKGSSVSRGFIILLPLRSELRQLLKMSLSERGSVGGKGSQFPFASCSLSVCFAVMPISDGLSSSACCMRFAVAVNFLLSESPNSNASKRLSCGPSLCLDNWPFSIGKMLAGKPEASSLPISGECGEAFLFS